MNTITNTIAKISVLMSMEKTTKNCVKFNENTLNELLPEKIGSIYVQKHALAEFGYKGGELLVTLECDNDEIETGILFKMEKATKNCIKFAEVVENEWTPERVGSIYVPKATLAEMGYEGGDIVMNISEFNVTEK